MDRRSFITTLIGGMAAASLGGIAAAQAAPATPAPRPEPAPATPEGEVTADMKEALDKSEAEFSQYYYYRRHRPVRRYYRPRVYYRRYYRPRYYYRPRRRVYYY